MNQVRVQSAELDKIGSQSKVVIYKGKQIKPINSRGNLDGILKFKKMSMSVLSVEKISNS